MPGPAGASLCAPSPEAEYAQGAPARQEGGYQPFFAFLQPPPRRPRGRSSVGVCVAEAAAACAVRGVGRPRPPGPLPPRRGPGLHPLYHLGRDPWDPDLLRGWDPERTGRPRPPRHSREAPGGSPSPSLAWRRNGERSGNGGGIRKRGLGAGEGEGVCRKATQSPPAGRLQGDLEGIGGWERKGAGPQR